ncbi:MAG TPA: TraB/GumN family protein [Casimicrobiaceae bacterium]|nr:TraB/GumN family protein [Casimicrobiaceae bacterium]
MPDVRLAPSRRFASPAVRTALRHALAAIAGASLLAGWGIAAAQAPAVERAASPAQSADDAPKRGLLFEVKSANTTVYLFGTIHVGRPEFYPLDAQTNRAFAASSTLYLEVNLSDSALVANASALATYPPGAAPRPLPPSVQAKLDAALDRYQLPRQAALAMKPWMLGQTLLLLEATRQGYDPAYATEIHLMGLATAQHKEVRGLETLDEQFAVFDHMPDDAQQRFLADIVDALDDPRMGTDLDALVGAWANADPRGLEDELARERAEGTAFAREVMPRLVDERNRTMAERIADIAKSGRTTFVAIGALHLVGQNGVVALLRARGLAVRPL